MRKHKAHTRRETGNSLRPIKPALLTLAIAQALAFQAVQAASIEVTSNLDDGTGCTLREALTTVNAGFAQGNGCRWDLADPLGTNDTITFSPAVSGQTITTIQGELEITRDVSINPGGVNTTIDADHASRAMSVISNDALDLTATVNQLTITGGIGGISVVNNFTQPYEYNTVSLTLTNSSVSGNTGDGISVDTGYAEVAPLTLTDSTVSDNKGDGIFVNVGFNGNGNVTLTDSTVSDNTGDGVSVSTPFTGGSVFLTNSTISNNGGSGIIGRYVVEAYLTNSTVSNNGGDGMYMLYGFADLYNSTVSGNMRDGVNADGFLDLVNSIVANNGSRDCLSYNYYSPFEISAGPDTVSTTVCGGATIADPLLGPLADNGGPTQTHALLAGSPAIDNGTGPGTATDQRGVGAEGVRDSGAYEFTGAINTLTLEKLINHRARQTPGTAAQLLSGSRYRSEYKVTNNSPNRLHEVQVFEGGELVCDLYGLNPGESKQPSRCASHQSVLTGLNNVPANVTAKVSGTSQELAHQANAFHNGVVNPSGGLNVTHYMNQRNADTQDKAVSVNGNEAEVLFRVENIGSIELYRVNTFHDPASPVNSGWEQQCVIGTLLPGQVRHCKRTVNVTQEGLNKAFGRAQGKNANVGATGVVNASNPTYFNVELP